MDQINPTLVLITFSFIWLIKQLTCHCIFKVKSKLLWSVFQKTCTCSSHVFSQHKIISWSIFLRGGVALYSVCCCSRIGLKRKYYTYSPDYT